MADIKTWIMASRAPFFVAVIIPCLLGTSIAWSHGDFNALLFVLVLVGVIMLNAGTNFVNDHFDYRKGKGSDAINVGRTPFSGGSPFLPEKILKPEKVLLAGIICFAAAAAIGIYLAVRTDIMILIFVVTGVLIGYFYTAPPIQLGYRGVGEFFTGLSLGPLIVLGTYYVFVQSMALEPIIAGIPVGILVAAILWVNEIPDYEADKKTGKNHLIVRLGKAKSASLIPLLFISAYLSIIAGVLTKIMPWTSLIALFTAPIAIKVVKTAKENYDDAPKYMPAMAQTIMTHSVTGVLLCIGYAACVIIFNNTCLL